MIQKKIIIIFKGINHLLPVVFTFIKFEFSEQVYIFLKSEFDFLFHPPRWLNGRMFALLAGGWGLIPDQDRSKSLKQVVTTALSNYRQQV